ncbi:MAG: hypothetical protein KatS3mg015_3131 [Fimbriimonadales bacterium]|nr:MAG: hypothetical protein KatS3mg015_3131 [Fimbriimonadales bacterium]
MPKAVRRITADVRTHIHALVDVLCDFLPRDTHAKNTVTFKSIFKESRVDHYLKGPTSKKQALRQGWEQVIRYHKRLPYTLIRKIVPAAIAYRRHKRNPLRQEEMDRLIECLDALGIDMRRELEAIPIDETLPEIQVPPEELVRRLENHPLVPEIAGEPLEMFRNGHFNEAVRKSAERFEVCVQKKAGCTETGQALMARSFNPQAPLIALNDLETENEKNIQEGYRFLTMGMMRAIRNIFSHGDEDQRSPEECYEMLLFLNWLFRCLDEATSTDV